MLVYEHPSVTYGDSSPTGEPCVRSLYREVIMRSIFNYENKFMQLLMTMGDMIILNLMFLLCCLPVVTIGAAQAGLCTGLRKLTDKDDDTSPAAAFMKGFCSGFGKITIAYSIMLALILLTGYTAASVAFYDVNGVKGAPVVLSIVSLCICALFQTTICTFHSRFSCTLWQLFRNAWFMILAHPLRTVLSAALAWSPVILFLGSPRVFILMTPVVITLFFSFIYLFVNSLMKKPFEGIIKLYNEKQAESQDAE